VINKRKTALSTAILVPRSTE